MDHLSSLNDMQKQAVLTTAGPLLILAGAGSGKTKVITHRILHLIKTGVAPSSILAITFTNKAAKEMRERVTKLIASESSLNLPTTTFELPFVSTFHALGVYILRENAARVGLPRHFTIFDRADAQSAVKEGLRALSLDEKQFPAGKLQSIISRKKGDGETLEAFREREQSDYFSKVLLNVWEKYEEVLRREKSVDFDDLLLKTSQLLRTDEEILRHYQSRWQYIHIDEYQDTNEVQYTMAKLLARAHGNICVVGDVDQNIYSWRGANIKNILSFEKDYPQVAEIVLEENYRSTQTILHAANEIIEKNKLRKKKRLFTNNVTGDKLGLLINYDEADEADFVARKAQELIAGGVSSEEIAVLYRANFQSRVLEEAFLANDVPYQLLGTRFFERKEVKDLLSFVALALNPESIAALKRVVNVPPRGIGKVTLLKIVMGQIADLPAGTKRKVNDFLQLMERIREHVSLASPSVLIRFIMKETGMEEILRGGNEEDRERLQNLQELVTLASRYDAMLAPLGLEKLVEDAALAADQDELERPKKGVKLMTVHASKGLEFEHVFITGLEEGLFPQRRDEKATEDAQEEERRLFYVALTRAKIKAYLSYASVRTIFGSRQVTLPSEFIFDIPPELFETSEELYAGKTVYLD